MTASLHKLSAGDGYTYLTDQVARNDATARSQGDRLADYYSEKGERPGVWQGRGLTGLSIEAGRLVSEDQMKALYGEGIHPDADRMVEAAIAEGKSKREALRTVALGRRFGDANAEQHPFVVEVAARFADWNEEQGRSRKAAIPAEVRASIRSEVARDCFEVEFGRVPSDARELAGYIAKASRPRSQSVAGFDVTFSPVKSVSTLWAVADRPVAAEIEAAHQAAIDVAMQWMEREVAYTRRGAGGVRQVETRGLITAQFQHRDSRAGDPDLHTHVVVSNKVQAVEDGAWLALDGAAVYAATVTVSEHYNAALEAELEARLGVQFAPRVAGARQRPVRELVGVPPELMARWSSRRAAIEAAGAQLIADFQATQGRAPSPVERLALMQQANLATRQAKHEPRSEAEQRAAWAEEAAQVIGVGGSAAVLGEVLGARIARRPVDVAALAETTLRDMETVSATWTDLRLRSRALHHLKGHGLTPDELDRAADQVVMAVVGGGELVRLNGDDPIAEPVQLQRRGGVSVYQRAHSERWTSRRILAAESTVIDAAKRLDGRRVDAAEVDLALLESVANGVELNPGQAELVRDLAVCGSRVRLALAPAGSGKTTAMEVLTRAWTASGGSVVGLAPSAVAAAELASATGGQADTIASLTDALARGRALPAWAQQVDETSLVVVDEAGMASTLDLAAVVEWAVDRGASVRLVGDDRQLSAVETGGVLRDIDAQVGSVGLRELMRFTDPDEAQATLAAREGRHDALGFYLDRGRVRFVDDSLLADEVFEAWAADQAAGQASLMLAADNATVDELNRRGRLLRLNGAEEDGTSVVLASGLEASAGDTIITRQNDRRLRSSTTDWVRNGERWTVQEVAPDGGLQVVHAKSGRQVRLPAEYVAEHVTLGYAATIHGAQGVTVDTTHTVLTGAETRELLYVAVSRGRHNNRIYLGGAVGGEHEQVYDPAVVPQTATDRLTAILDREGGHQSAHTIIRLDQDPGAVLGRVTAIYGDALVRAQLDVLGEPWARSLHQRAEELLPELTSHPGWEPLVASLAAAELDGQDAQALLEATIGLGTLDGARDPAAVLERRLGGAGGGPLQWLRPVPVQLSSHAVWGPYFEGRTAQLREAAAAVWQQAHDRPPARWAVGLDSVTRAEVAVWRAATGVPVGDETPLGPPHRRTAERAYQIGMQTRLGTPGTRWAGRVDQRVVEDPWWQVLGRRLDLAASRGLDVDQVLQVAAEQGPLPDDLPAAAMWSRISSQVVDQGEIPARVGRHRPAYVGTLSQLMPDQAEQVVSSTGWRALTEAIAAGEAAGLDPHQLVADAVALIDPLPGEGGDAIAARLTGRIEQLVDDQPEPPLNAEELPQSEGMVPDVEVGGQLVDEAVDEQLVGRIVELHDRAAQIYADAYRGSSAARYIEGRFGDDLAADPRVTIGYAPAGWSNLTDQLVAEGATVPELVEAGLTKMSRRGSPIDIFRDRVVVGIRDEQGRLVGFTGRAAPGADPTAPKYLNTPATPAFAKGRLLLGWAENADRLAGGAVPVRVEGAFDAIAVTRATDGAAVGLAPLGTALTAHQADMIAAAANGRPILEATDTDRAGQEAALRDHERLVDVGVEARRMVLVNLDDPAKAIKDPAESVGIDGGAAVRAAVDGIEVAPTLTGEAVRTAVDSVEQSRLVERVDTQALLAQRLGHVIAASNPAGWDDEVARAAELLAERAGTDVAWCQELIDASTSSAAREWLPPVPADRAGLSELAWQQRNAEAMARQEQLRARLSALSTHSAAQHSQTASPDVIDDTQNQTRGRHL